MPKLVGSSMNIDLEQREDLLDDGAAFVARQRRLSQTYTAEQLDL